MNTEKVLATQLDGTKGNYSTQCLMSYPHIAGRLLNTPLAVTQEKLGIYLSYFENMQLTGSVRDMAEFLNNENGIQAATQEQVVTIPNTLYRMQGSAGILEVFGTLVNRGSARARPYSGMVSYEYLGTVLGKMVEDSSVESIYLFLDTPGGEVAGVASLAEYIKGIEKPIYAVVTDMSTSAGYFLAAATDRIYISPTGKVGSIGIVTAIRKPQENTATLVLYKGKYKAIGTDDITDEQLAYLNDQLEQYYTLFVDSLAKYRGKSSQFYRDTEAAIYIGQRAIEMGLADAIASAEFYKNIGMKQQPPPPARSGQRRSTRMPSEHEDMVENDVAGLQAKLRALEAENETKAVENAALLRRIEAVEAKERENTIAAAAQRLEKLPVSATVLTKYLADIHLIGDELFADTLTILNACVGAIDNAVKLETAGHMQEADTGTSDASRRGNVTRVRSLIDEKMRAKPGMSQMDAFREVFKENPDLRGAVA